MCFKTFVDDVSKARREGDISPDLSIIADTMKLIGNSGYGSLIMDKTKHRKIEYKRVENNACLAVNSPQFRQLSCLDPEDEYYEIELAKNQIKLSLPVQLGYFILQYAKLRMLQFYYDFLDRYVDRSDFEYIAMDTDSDYMAISDPSLEAVIKPEMLNQYRHILEGLCDDVEHGTNSRWLPRSCCSKHGKLTNVPRDFLGCISKVMKWSDSALKCTSSAEINQTKFSAKGISKRFVDNPMHIYKDVLSSEIPQSGINKGFRVRNNAIYIHTIKDDAVFLTSTVRGEY